MNGQARPARTPISWGSLILIGLIVLIAGNAGKEELKRETESLQSRVRSLESTIDEQHQLLNDLYVHLVVARGASEGEAPTKEPAKAAEAEDEGAPEGAAAAAAATEVGPEEAGGVRVEAFTDELPAGHKDTVGNSEAVSIPAFAPECEPEH